MAVQYTLFNAAVPSDSHQSPCVHSALAQSSEKRVAEIVEHERTDTTLFDRFQMWFVNPSWVPYVPQKLSGQAKPSRPVVSRPPTSERELYHARSASWGTTQGTAAVLPLVTCKAPNSVGLASTDGLRFVLGLAGGRHHEFQFSRNPRAIDPE